MSKRYCVEFTETLLWRGFVDADDEVNAIEKAQALFAAEAEIQSEHFTLDEADTEDWQARA